MDQRRWMIFGLVFVGTVSGAMAGDLPIAVSPGSTERIEPIGVACPTFSWSGAKGASGYELVVYELGSQRTTSREVLTRQFRGAATSWTPPLDRCLARGRTYA